MTSTAALLPSEENFAEKTKELAELWGADAIRNSDGIASDEAVLARQENLQRLLPDPAPTTSGSPRTWTRPPQGLPGDRPYPGPSPTRWMCC